MECGDILPSQDALSSSAHVMMVQNRLGDSVTAVNTEVGTSDISSRIRQQESHGSHEVFWTTHLALRNQTGPLLGKLWVVIKNLLGTIIHQVSFGVSPLALS